MTAETSICHSLYLWLEKNNMSIVDSIPGGRMFEVFMCLVSPRRTYRTFCHKDNSMGRLMLNGKYILPVKDRISTTSYLVVWLWLQPCSMGNFFSGQWLQSRKGYRKPAGYYLRNLVWCYQTHHSDAKQPEVAADVDSLIGSLLFYVVMYVWIIFKNNNKQQPRLSNVYVDTKI